MNPPLSIIIPVLNEADQLDRLLPTLAFQSGVEVIVVDGGSADGSLGRIRNYPSVRLVHAAQGRGVQLNRGAEVATGNVLWFLHADSSPEPDWLENILIALEEPHIVAGCFRLRFDEEHWLLKVFSFFSRWNHPLVTYGDQGYFMKRSTFEAIGGFKDYPILEDLEIQCRLRRRGQWRKLPISLTTSARRFTTVGILRQQLKNILIVSLFLAGTSPFWLSRFYKPQCQLKPAAQSASLKPTALKVEVSK